MGTLQGAGCYRWGSCHPGATREPGRTAGADHSPQMGLCFIPFPFENLILCFLSEGGARMGEGETPRCLPFFPALFPSSTFLWVLLAAHPTWLGPSWSPGAEGLC